MAKDKKSDNMKSLGKGFYIVKTQAGFRKAFKTFFKEWIEEKDPNFKVKDLCHVGMFPKTYPSFVSMQFDYRGYHTPVVKCIGLDKINEVINDLKIN